MSRLWRRFTAWLDGEVVAEIVDAEGARRAIEEVAEEKRAEIVQALGEFVESLDLEDTKKFRLKHQIARICGECGPNIENIPQRPLRVVGAEASRYDTCQWCGGYAQTFENEPLKQRATMRRLKRHVEERQRAGDKRKA